MLLSPYLVAIFVLCIFTSLGTGAPPNKRQPENQNKLINALNHPAQNVLDKPGEEHRKVPDDSAKEPLQLPKPNKAVRKRPDLVKRPDHLEAVPLERDGHLNKKFREEVFLGKDTNGIVAWHEMGGVDGANDEHAESNKKKEKEKEPEELLVDVFKKADENGNGKLSLKELEEWIFKTALHHLEEAVEETKHIFEEIDQDSDGILTWEEYHYHFLTDKNLMPPDKARKHKEEDHAELNPEDQDTIQNELEKWKEANSDGEDGLNHQEFLAFRHPEHSLKMLKNMVVDIIRTLDKNGDGRLSLAEFAAPPPGQLENGWEKEEKNYLDERRKEFKEEIDLNGDGEATQEELLKYSNPRNPQHARHEAKELLELADTDSDKQLSLDEVLAHKAIFFGSSLLNPSRNLHDEM